MNDSIMYIMKCQVSNISSLTLAIYLCDQRKRKKHLENMELLVLATASSQLHKYTKKLLSGYKRGLIV